MEHDQLIAAIDDLDKELGRHGTGEDARLRKIVCFCNTSLALHEGLDEAGRHRVNARLHGVAKKHGLPDECVLAYPGHGAPC
ncbi:hypothetical protein AO715_04065 [Xanthomonas sp. Mitacek01]|nr:hypothetical protein AO715_04065 [Xanthomonas sp. Mitacek01]